MAIVLSACQMQACDNRTINDHGVSSLVLMERAALKVVEVIEKEFPETCRFLVVCGPGNNGGDGVAIARLLHLKGNEVKCIILGNQKKYSPQLQQEISIAESYGLKIDNKLDKTAVEKTDITIDAMFGIGLTRGLSGDFENAANIIRSSAKKVVAVDIPSGYDADCGKCLGEVGICADVTVTFAYMKKGLLLGDCKAAAGKVYTVDVGIYIDDASSGYSDIVEADIIKSIEKRPVNANKGSCGKLLIIAGSESIYGACYLSAKSALATGAGLVKIYTHRNNIVSIQQNLPEAMYLGYDTFNEQELLEQIRWADTILIGPGLGTGALSKKILKKTLEESSTPIVIDADGLNIVADDSVKPVFKKAAMKNPVVITPHLKEMERLSKLPVSQINYNMENVAKNFAIENNCIVVLKNFTTIIAERNSTHFVTSGSEALATPGSGDVLAGAIASLIVQKVNTSIEIAVETATFIHGVAGVNASKEHGVRGVLASHIIENFPNI